MVKHNKVDGTKTKSRVGLIAILATLVVAIVALVVGIVVVNSSKTNDYSENELVEEFIGAIAPLNVDESEAYLDKKLDEFGGTGLVPRIKMMKMYVYLNAGLFNDAAIVASDINENELSEDVKMEYYNALSQIYDGIGNEDKFNYYSEKWIGLYNKIYNGGGGGE